jgi:hypothetical protein
VKGIPSKAKILLIKLRSIGDVVYNTAVYSPIKKCFPDAHLTVVVENRHMIWFVIIQMLMRYCVLRKNYSGSKLNFMHV